MAQLNSTESALKQSQLDCEALKVQLEKQLSEKDESHKKELAKTVEMFRKQLTEKETVINELPDKMQTSRVELSLLCESWMKETQQWETEKRELEEMLTVKEKIWTHQEANFTEDIQLLKQEVIQIKVCCLSFFFLGS